MKRFMVGPTITIITAFSFVILVTAGAAQPASNGPAQNEHLSQTFDGYMPRLAPRRASAITEIEPVHIGLLQTRPQYAEQPTTLDAGDLSRNFRVELETLRARVKAEGFLPVEEDLQTGLAVAQPEKRLNAALLLATLYVVHDLHAEALSVIEELEDAGAHADFVLLGGIAKFKMGRFDDAVATFSDELLQGNPEAGRWRGIANARRGAYGAAADDLIKAPVGPLSFENSAAAFFLAKAETAMAQEDNEIARAALKGLQHSPLDNAHRAHRALLEARVMLAQNRSEPGRRVLQQLAGSGPAPFANLAAIELLNDSFNHGAIDPGEAAERNKSLMLTWRGGAFERRALTFAALMHEAAGEIGAAYRARRQIMDGFPDTDAAAAAEQKMRADLATLLERGSLSPLDAAQIFYENIDLAPPGRAGDELIRKVADKLVALDLLSQAAELLHHQTFERLRGADRSRVAGDLAGLYLTNGKPLMALQVLRSTRLARLPDGLNNQRRWLEARALIDSGDGTAALALLKNDQSGHGAKLRGEIFWDGQQWGLAGDAFRVAAGLPVEIEEPLDRAQSVLVLRAASSYGLAGAHKELRRLGRKASGKLVDTDANHLLEGLAYGGLTDNPATFRAAYRAFFGDAATAS